MELWLRRKLNSRFSLPRRLTAAKFIVVVCVACVISWVPWYSPEDEEGAPGSGGWWSWSWRRVPKILLCAAVGHRHLCRQRQRHLAVNWKRHLRLELTCFVHANAYILQSGRTRINLFIIWGAPSRIVLLCCSLDLSPSVFFSHLSFNKRRVSARIAAYFRKLYASHAFVFHFCIAIYVVGMIHNTSHYMAAENLIALKLASLLHFSYFRNLFYSYIHNHSSNLNLAASVINLISNVLSFCCLVVFLLIFTCQQKIKCHFNFQKDNIYSSLK